MTATRERDSVKAMTGDELTVLPLATRHLLTAARQVRSHATGPDDEARLLDECGLNGVLKQRILAVLRALSFALLPPEDCGRCRECPIGQCPVCDEQQADSAAVDAVVAVIEQPGVTDAQALPGYVMGFLLLVHVSPDEFLTALESVSP